MDKLHSDRMKLGQGETSVYLLSRLARSHPRSRVYIYCRPEIGPAKLPVPQNRSYGDLASSFVSKPAREFIGAGAPASSLGTAPAMISSA
jgi:hypothetical protein